MLMLKILIDTTSTVLLLTLCSFIFVAIQGYPIIESPQIQLRPHWMRRIIFNQRLSIVNNVRKPLERIVSTSLMNTACKTDSVTNHKIDRTDLHSVDTKDIWIIRHGQAVHNPRAEYARDVLQCSHDEFLSIMEEDDCFDAPLTSLGIQQAQQIYTQYGMSHWRGTPTINNNNNIHVDDDDDDEHKQESVSSALLQSSNQHHVELVVSSPLSRALHTAELVLGDVFDTTTTNRVCYEGFREINGWLQNGKRHTRTQLEEKFPSWDFSLLSSNDDDQWTPTLETTDSCMERGYSGLQWIMNERPERSIVLVSHGALLKYTLTDHPNVILRDGRTQQAGRLQQVADGTVSHNKEEEEVVLDSSIEANLPAQQNRCIRKRYHNCEIRRYRMERSSTKQNDDDDTSSDTVTTSIGDDTPQHHDVIILTEVDL